MTLHADSALPEDPAALAAMIAALRGALPEERPARRIAELGLQAKTLDAERLLVQIARLRHERFGRSSERLAGEVEQLELRLDEVLTDIAAAGGAARPRCPQAHHLLSDVQSRSCRASSFRSQSLDTALCRETGRSSESAGGDHEQPDADDVRQLVCELRQSARILEAGGEPFGDAGAVLDLA